MTYSNVTGSKNKISVHIKIEIFNLIRLLPFPVDEKVRYNETVSHQYH